MKIHILQHEDAVGPGHVGRWAATRGHDAVIHRPDHGQPFPAFEPGQMLVILGGSMGANDERDHPWLAWEKRYIEQVIEQGGHVLGICLGGQILASVLGGEVRRHKHKEIGWHTLALCPDAIQVDCLSDYPGLFPAFQWHQDTFSIPAGCLHLAESEGCAHQGFAAAGGRVIALQFHLEADLEVAHTLAKRFPEDLAHGGPYVQPVASILGNQDSAARSTALAETLLDRLAEAALAPVA